MGTVETDYISFFNVSLGQSFYRDLRALANPKSIKKPPLKKIISKKKSVLHRYQLTA